MTTANTDQHAAWNGESGQRWVASAEGRDTVLAPIANLLLDAAEITAGERVLDIGCGCGATTLAAADATGPTGTVVGADPSTIQDLLTAAGFADISTEPHTLALRFGTSVTEAADYLADSGPGRAILETIAPERHDDALAAVSDALRPHHDPDHGVMLEAAVLLTTARTRP